MTYHTAKTREIHYEVAPPSRRRPVSWWRILFATLVALFIISALLFALYILWYVYMRPPPPPPAYVKSDEVDWMPTTTRPAPEKVITKEKLYVILVSHKGNKYRADDVANYYKSHLPVYLNRTRYDDFSVKVAPSSILSSFSSNQMDIMKLTVNTTLEVSKSGVAVFVSELFPPTAEQLLALPTYTDAECSPDGVICMEFCSLNLRPDNLQNLAQNQVDYQTIDYSLIDINRYLQVVDVYRQYNNDMFLVKRKKKNCTPTVN